MHTEKTNGISFSRVLTTLREKKGMSQADLAGILKCSRSAIGMYESGQREPDIKTLWSMADLFGIDIDQLVGRKNIEQQKIRMTNDSLCVRIRKVIETSEARYGEVIKILSWLLCAYEDKGMDLLNGSSIQEVAAHEQHQSMKLP